MDRRALREVVGKQRSLEILELLAAAGPLNYTDIVQQVDSSTDVVSDRLETLVQYGLVDRTEHSARDVQYDCTEKGEQFIDQLDTLSDLLSGAD